METDRPSDLPDFDDPPVVEVALSLQFAQVPLFRTVHFGLLWDRFRDQFPNFREQPPLDSAFETFGAQRSTGHSVRLELSVGPPMPRLWLINEDETQLIQFQTDRFAHNWRKLGDDSSYPRYESIKEEFAKEIQKVTGFLSEFSLGEIAPNQCEISYINHIRSEKNEDLRVELDRVLKTMAIGGLKETSLPPFEDARASMRFVIRSAEDKPIGRLIATTEPARDRDGTPMVVVSLVARGTPAEPTIGEALKFLDIGRTIIVRGFADLTTDEMHKRWGRKQ